MKTDVAIVGAGPAGSRAALVLARAGARVELLDPSHPREKPCGGGVTGRALALATDTINARQLETVAIRAARFIRDDGERRDVRIPLDGTALIVCSRRSFDAALLDAAIAAGAEYHPVRVADISVEREGVRLATARGARRAAFVIGADGANSLVRRRLARMFRRDQLSTATGFFAHGVASDEIALELVSTPAGYIWSFPRRDHLAIGICAQADSGASVSALRQLTARWMERSGCAHGASLTAYSWPIPSLSPGDFDGLEVAGPRWCLVGDAAGLVDPITREGIYFALASGQWAAETLAQRSGTKAYSMRVRDEAAPELAFAARLKDGFFRPAFTRLFMTALGRSAAVRGVTADLIAGRQDYRTLKQRLIAELSIW